MSTLNFDLLDQLRRQYRFTQAQAKGAEQAYRLEVLREAEEWLKERLVEPGYIIRKIIGKNVVCYQYHCLSFDPDGEKSPILMGFRAKRDNRPGKTLVTICSVDDLRHGNHIDHPRWDRPVLRGAAYFSMEKTDAKTKRQAGAKR